MSFLMQCYDQEINIIEWMYALTDELCVGILRVKLSCLNRCLVPYGLFFSTQNTQARSTDITKDEDPLGVASGR